MQEEEEYLPERVARDRLEENVTYPELLPHKNRQSRGNIPRRTLEQRFLHPAIVQFEQRNKVKIHRENKLPLHATQTRKYIQSGPRIFTIFPKLNRFL